MTSASSTLEGANTRTQSTYKISEEELKKGNFMAHPIAWIREPAHTSRTILAVFAAIILTATGIGLIVVIAGAIEWRRQINVQRSVEDKQALSRTAAYVEQSLKAEEQRKAVARLAQEEAARIAEAVRKADAAKQADLLAKDQKYESLLLLADQENVDIFYLIIKAKEIKERLKPSLKLGHLPPLTRAITELEQFEDQVRKLVESKDFTKLTEMENSLKQLTEKREAFTKFLETETTRLENLKTKIEAEEQTKKDEIERQAAEKKKVELEKQAEEAQKKAEQEKQAEEVQKKAEQEKQVEEAEKKAKLDARRAKELQLGAFQKVQCVWTGLNIEKAGNASLASTLFNAFNTAFGTFGIQSEAILKAKNDLENSIKDLNLVNQTNHIDYQNALTMMKYYASTFTSILTAEQERIAKQ